MAEGTPDGSAVAGPADGGGPAEIVVTPATAAQVRVVKGGGHA